MIIGPSHVVRLETLRETLNINDTFLGCGGLPIWHENIKKNLKQKNFIFVGDFRFGNEYLLTGDEKEKLRINKGLINIESDTLCLSESKKAISDISKIASEKKIEVRFLFWCLFAREYENRKKKRYTCEGIYSHPTWNLKELETTTKNCISLHSIINQNLDSLFIDSSNHPSLQGFIFIKNLYEGKEASEAFLDSIGATEIISRHFTDFTPSVISGTSSPFRVIKEYIKRGVLNNTISRIIKIREADEALFSSYKYHSHLIHFSSDKDAKIDETTLSFFDKSLYDKKLLVITNNDSTEIYEGKTKEKPQVKLSIKHDRTHFEVDGKTLNLIGLLKILFASFSLLSGKSKKDIPLDHI